MYTYTHIKSTIILQYESPININKHITPKTKKDLLFICSDSNVVNLRLNSHLTSMFAIMNHII